MYTSYSSTPMYLYQRTRGVPTPPHLHSSCATIVPHATARRAASSHLVHGQATSGIRCISIEEHDDGTLNRIVQRQLQDSIQNRVPGYRSTCSVGATSAPTHSQRRSSRWDPNDLAPVALHSLVEAGARLALFASVDKRGAVAALCADVDVAAQRAAVGGAVG